MKKSLSVFAALSLLTLLAGCAEQGAQSKDPNAFAKETYFYSNKNESKPSEESSALAINGDVMWGIGKTFDEVSERYGDITAGNFNVYTFKNGYGKYAWDDDGGIDPTQSDRDENIKKIRERGGCKIIGEISASDFLIGDLSTVTLDNIAEKCGFDVFQYNPDPDEETLYDEYKFAYCEHPDYDNVSISIMYNRENGFDETARFRVSYSSET